MKDNRSKTTPHAVELHIEELVLHGFEVSERKPIADGMQQQLAQLIGSQDIPLSALQGEAGTVDAGEFTVKSGASRTSIGQQVADSVYRGIARRNA